MKKILCLTIGLLISSTSFANRNEINKTIIKIEVEATTGMEVDNVELSNPEGFLMNFGRLTGEIAELLLGDSHTLKEAHINLKSGLTMNCGVSIKELRVLALFQCTIYNKKSLTGFKSIQ